MATASVSGSCHLGLPGNQKRWLVAGIALNKILIPQIRTFVEQGINTEYNNLKTSHNIHIQSTSGRLQRWPARKVLKYENINGNDVHPRLSGGRFNYSLFDCQVTSHVDFARLYVEKYMAHFTAFDDHCDASAVLTLLGGVPVFSAGVQTAAGDVRMGRNDWAHCVFSKWDQVKFQQSFIEMEHLVRVMALPSADEGKLLGELKDWETKGTHLCMNHPVDPALLQLVQQDLKSLQDAVENMSVEFEEEKRKVQHELQNIAMTLEEMKERMQRLEIGQQNLEQRTAVFEGDVNQRMERLEITQQNTDSRTTLVEDKVHHLQEQVEDLALSKKYRVSMGQDNTIPAAFPEKLVELIRRDYKGAALCPFAWCEDELQLELSNIFTRLKIISKEKERARPTDDIVNMTDVFRPRKECDKPRVVLIEGQPGMGKTTYCQKLAYDWSVEDLAPDTSFPKVDMLLLLKCRDMKTANIEEAIDDQLLPQDAGNMEKENFIHFIRFNQSRILLVLDGLDELPQDLFQGFLPLIQSKVFSNTYLMLTTRHGMGMKVRRYCDTLLEIVGYTSADADSYITKYFSNHEDPSLAKKLIEKLTDDPQLRELTANPLNTALLCLVCEDTRGIFPTNRSKLYHELVSCALRRDFAKKNKPVPVDPVETSRDQLNQLGKMALKALKEDRMYFIEDETKCHSNDLIPCFLSRQPSVSKIRPVPCYAFTHKTFQEHFAAFHLAHELFTGDKAGRDTLLAQLSPVDKYWEVWEFLFTMVVSKSHDDAIYLLSRLCACLYHKRPEELIETKDDAVINVSRICEDTSYDWVNDIERRSKEEDVVQNVLGKTFHLIAACEYDKNELKDYQKKMVLTLVRCLPVYKFEVISKLARAVSFVFSEYLKANYTLTHLRLCGVLDDLGLATIKIVLQSDHKLKYLNVWGGVYQNFFDMMTGGLSRCHLILRSLGTLSTQVSGAIALTELLHSNRTLKYLNLRYSSTFNPGAKAFARVLKFNRTLTHLNLESASIFDCGAKALAEALRSNCTLKYLGLSKNWITDLGAEAFATGLQCNHTLRYLDLGENDIGNRGVIALARGLELNVGLAYLYLHQSIFSRYCEHDERAPIELIDVFGASALARALQTNCTLTYLGLQQNEVGDSGAEEIGKALKSNRNLTHLYLNNNVIGDPGAEAIAKALQSGQPFTQLNSEQQRSVGDTRLTRLDLSGNKIGSPGATALADALQYNNTLQRLDLSSNKIDCSGATALAKALRSNQTLTHLDLGCNKIGDTGATEFAETLKYNDTLTILDLTFNPIGEFGAENLRQVDQSFCSLKYDDPEKH